MARATRAFRFTCLAVFIVLIWHFHWYSFFDTSTPPAPIQEKKRLVVASLKRDDTTWLAKRLPDWHVSQYIVDDPTANLTVAVNKGRESNVYLTYIIDNYDNLPEIMVFIHAVQYQWHNDDSNKDGATVISRLQLPNILSEGYVNLRCDWALGCPVGFKVDSPGVEHDLGVVFRESYQELFPNKTMTDGVPSAVGAGCCAQFALSAAKVWEKPKSEYERIRRWLIETPLTDDTSGRVMEYSWHMIFDRPPIHCPDTRTCYCQVFGLCDLENCEPGRCEGQYILPPFSTKPEGWKPLPEFNQD